MAHQWFQVTVSMVLLLGWPGPLAAHSCPGLSGPAWWEGTLTLLAEATLGCRDFPCIRVLNAQAHMCWWEGQPV